VLLVFIESFAYALVTHATSGENPSMWSFSRSKTFAEMNIGKYEFWTSISLIRALNHSECGMSKEGKVARFWRHLGFAPKCYMTRV
jgi:hypothetical protein